MSSLFYSTVCLVGLSCVVLALDKPEQLLLQQQADVTLKQNVSEELQSITKSLEDLLSEFGHIKREATGRLSNVKNRASTTDQERIRQTKVSRFVLSRVAELESESLSMRDELAKFFNVQRLKSNNNQPALLMMAADPRQEDLDFDEPATATVAQGSSSTQNGATSSEGMPLTTTIKPEDEAAKIGFDMEALKKLGEEIGKRLDQFGKETAKNLGDLIEGVKLVFREPNSKKRNNTSSGGSLFSKTKVVYDIATIAPPKTT